MVIVGRTSGGGTGTSTGGVVLPDVPSGAGGGTEGVVAGATFSSAGRGGTTGTTGTGGPSPVPGAGGGTTRFVPASETAGAGAGPTGGGKGITTAGWTGGGVGRVTGGSPDAGEGIDNGTIADPAGESAFASVGLRAGGPGGFGAAASGKFEGGVVKEAVWRAPSFTGVPPAEGDGAAADSVTGFGSAGSSFLSSARASDRVFGSWRSLFTRTTPTSARNEQATMTPTLVSRTMPQSPFRIVSTGRSSFIA
jgi:hypothetical protein